MLPRNLPLARKFYHFYRFYKQREKNLQKDISTAVENIVDENLIGKEIPLKNGSKTVYMATKMIYVE